MKWICKWKVPSRSARTKTKSYTVSLADDGQMGCSCPAWTRRRLTCSHIRHIHESYSDEHVREIFDAYKSGRLVSTDYEYIATVLAKDKSEAFPGEHYRSVAEEAKERVKKKRAERRAMADALSTIIENAEWRMA